MVFFGEIYVFFPLSQRVLFLTKKIDLHLEKPMVQEVFLS
jgi:hypothetical protein